MDSKVFLNQVNRNIKYRMMQIFPDEPGYRKIAAEPGGSGPVGMPTGGRGAGGGHLLRKILLRLRSRCMRRIPITARTSNAPTVMTISRV